MLTSRSLRVVVLGCVAVALLTLSIGCGGTGSSQPASSSSPAAKSSTAASASPAPSTKAPEASTASSADALTRLADAAKSEGKIVVYGPPGQVRPALVDAFQKEFPGLTVEFWTPGQQTDIITRITSEAKAGKVGADVVLWGPTTQWGSLVPLGIYDTIPDKLVLPETQSKDVWSRGKLDYQDIAGKHLLALQYDMGNMLLVNTSDPMVAKLKSYKDLLAPEWKGKFAVADPATVGQALSAFSVFYDSFGEDFFKQMGANSPKLAADANQVVDWVARGVVPVGISAGHTLLVPFIKQGIPIKGYNLEGLSYASPGYWTIGLMKQSQHPKTAQLYLNWLLTKNGQSAVANAALKSPIRKDVDLPKDVLPLDTSLKLFEPLHETNKATNDKTIQSFNNYIKKGAQ